MFKILLITIELPYPPTSGGRMKSWNMLKYLSQRHEVGLACPVKYGDKQITKMRGQIKLKEFIADRCEIPRTPKNLIKSYLHRIPLNVYRSKSQVVLENVAKVADQYQIILIDHYEAFQYIPQNYRGKVVFHAHNATYLMWERFAVTGSNALMRLVARLEAERVKAYEKNVCEHADMIFAAPNDIEMLSVLGVCKDKFRETYHLGDDSQLDLPSIRFDQTRKKILYVGTLNWEANIDGLLWFIKEVWPQIVQSDPSIVLDIVGGNPDTRIVAACEPHANIHLLGFVENLEDCFKDSRVFIAPLRFGSGIKVKVLNSMCRGLPIVTTSVGVEGIDIEHMKHSMVADDALAYATAVIRLMVDKVLWETIETNSRKLIVSKYTWKKVLGDLNQEIIQLCNDRTQ